MSDDPDVALESAQVGLAGRHSEQLLALAQRLRLANGVDECLDQFGSSLRVALGAATHRICSADDQALRADSDSIVAVERAMSGDTSTFVNAGGRALLLVALRLHQTPAQLAVFERAAPFNEAERHVAALAAALLEGALRSQALTQALRESQARLSQSERVKSIGQLAGGVAHDFNNMLMVMSAAAEVMRDTLPGEHPCMNHLKLILETSHRAAELTQKLLAFSRKNRPALQPVDVHEILKAVQEFLVHSLDRRISLSLSLAAGACWVNADSTELQNALLNICLNARDAMPGGGQLKISTECVELGVEACARERPGLEPGSYVRIDVRDTGIGMDEHTLKHAFDPFFTTKDPGRGTGLGLAVVFGSIREHGGSVALASQPGVGTVCTLLLPLIDRRAAAGALLPHLRPAGMLRVLLLDDEPGVCRTTALLMRQLGHNVQALQSGEKALSHLRTHWSGYDLLVLDVVMPHPTGVEVHRALVAEGITLPTVFVSGYSEQHLLEGIEEGHGIVFLQKPFRQAELARAIARCMETAPAEPAGHETAEA